MRSQDLTVTFLAVEVLDLTVFPYCGSVTSQCGSWDWKSVLTVEILPPSVGAGTGLTKIGKGFARPPSCDLQCPLTLRVL